MPTNGNQVKFQYIGTTAPASYNADTVYFDNVNGNIKVGSTVVAEKNTGGSNKRELTLLITDVDKITHQHTTTRQDFEYVSPTGGTFNDWAAALLNPDDYILKIEWTPSSVNSDVSVTAYGDDWTYVFTNWSIDKYSSCFIFSLPVVSGAAGADTRYKNDIIEIIVDPANTGVTAVLRTEFKIQFLIPSSWPSSYTSIAQYTAWQNIGWYDIQDNKDNLCLEMYKTTSPIEFISCKTYDFTNESEVVFGPFMHQTSAYYVDVMKNGTGIDAVLSKL